MNKTVLFTESLKMLQEIKYEISKSNLMDCGPRLELVEQCINISIEHSIGVNLLLSTDLTMQGMVLLRAQFEAVVRAYWLMFIAENSEISVLNFSWTLEEQYLNPKIPMAHDMLELLLKANLDAHGIILQLKEFKEINLKVLHSFVHTGKHAFTRQQIGFDENLVIQLMRISNNLTSTAAQLLLYHSVPNNQKFISSITYKYKSCFTLLNS
ncbi:MULTISPECIES: DUF6988 family protein [Acinetobacter]|uniref:Uncharacterized protein n=2 Tax=Acinetobacter TaxID=469 RepID=N8UXH5_9GAMM|nr:MULTISPECIES: hypothetical protein [Acinetobacter]ENU92080.1 hypothetical protein F971_01967 [Acinetobacter vivianii]ENW92769.1 hypothetical protein F904_02712 [Acinetobacter dispersus]